MKLTHIVSRPSFTHNLSIEDKLAGKPQLVSYRGQSQFFGCHDNTRKSLCSSWLPQLVYNLLYCLNKLLLFVIFQTHVTHLKTRFNGIIIFG